MNSAMTALSMLGPLRTSLTKMSCGWPCMLHSWSQSTSRHLMCVSTDAPTTQPSTCVTQACSRCCLLLSKGEQECIVILFVIHRLEALTLLDCGSTTQLLNNSFMDVSKVDIVELKNPMIPQLGCVGSRSWINFRTTAPVTLGDFRADVYFNLANLNRYNTVFGTPFLWQFGFLLDFKNNCMIINGIQYPALSKVQVSNQIWKHGGGGCSGCPHATPPACSHQDTPGHFQGEWLSTVADPLTTIALQVVNMTLINGKPASLFPKLLETSQISMIRDTIL